MNYNLRIPGDFVISKGKGCSEFTQHAGSYHLALFEANISDYNIFTYSSVIPATSNELSLDEVDLPPFGTELPCIQAKAEGFYGEHISAGIIWAWMYKDKDMTEKVGGLVCELGGYYDVESLEERLKKVHNDLHNKTYSQYVLGEQNIITNSLTVDNRFGTVLVNLAFVNYYNNENK